jgi:hypothetical protein
MFPSAEKVRVAGRSTDPALWVAICHTPTNCWADAAFVFFTGIAKNNPASINTIFVFFILNIGFSFFYSTENKKTFTTPRRVDKKIRWTPEGESHPSATLLLSDTFSI